MQPLKVLGEVLGQVSHLAGPESREGDACARSDAGPVFSAGPGSRLAEKFARPAIAAKIICCPTQLIEIRRPLLLWHM